MTRNKREKGWKQKVYRELKELVLEMNYTVDAIIVEGPHDHKTLMFLGYKGRILECSKLSHNNLVDLLAERYSKVVIFTDFDDHGSFLNKKLSHLFEQRGIEVAHFYRRMFSDLLQKTQIYTIEGIYNLRT